MTLRARAGALVAGLFGEWGCGKTLHLRHIHHYFLTVLEQASDSVVTLPVFFNAWRAVSWLKDKAARLGEAAVAIGCGIKGKFTVPVFGELEIDPSAMVEEDKERRKKRVEERKSYIDNLESLYYDFETEMRRLTGREGGGTKLNFLFLIDDLDRCLPESAVKMLESIKLFLDVARENGWPRRQRTEQLTLLRVVILQLLAPDLYRFGRHNPLFLAKMESWFDKDTKQANLFLVEDKLRNRIKENEEAVKNKTDKAQAAADDLKTARQFDQRLLELVHAAQQHRSRFDPLKLIDPANPSDKDIRHYFNLEPSAVTFRTVSCKASLTLGDIAMQVKGVTAAPESVQIADERTSAAPSDPDGFFSQLFSTDEIAWRNAIEQEAERLTGRVLDDASFRALVDRVRRAPQVVSA